MTNEIWEKFYKATEEDFNKLPYLTIGKLREYISQVPEICDDDPIKIVTKSDEEDTAAVVRPVKLIDNDYGLELYTTRF